MTEVNTFPVYFDRVYIINLPSRPDRLKSIMGELDKLGFAGARERIFVPEAPMPEDPNGFPSKGVFGNFLSHFTILRDAQELGLDRILVLEDDAIFLRALRKMSVQAGIIGELESHHWGMWFGGHRLRQELSGQPKGVIPTKLGFAWAHCYAVHGRSLGALIDYLAATMERPRGHPLGGRMYIDGAFSMFRDLHPGHLCLISNPAVSIQKGTTSNLGELKSYDSSTLVRPLVGKVRALRDEFWRRTGIDFRKGLNRKSAR
ncbi:MAG TPA: hypothetical protein VKA19_15555 [Alphaproteobacteria bacterium]|nr:hypothetical protein [Alphaproteobacteria bacterium]